MSRALMNWRREVEAAGFTVTNPSERTYLPKRFPWRVRGPEGSCWSVRATEREALEVALRYVRRRGRGAP